MRCAIGASPAWATWSRHGEIPRMPICATPATMSSSFHCLRSVAALIESWPMSGIAVSREFAWVERAALAPARSIERRMCGGVASGVLLADLDDFHRVGAARFAHRLADRHHDQVALLDLAALQQLRFGRAQHLIAVGALLEEERAHVAVECHLA